MTRYTELDRRLIDKGHPFTPSELMEFTQELQDVLMEERYDVVPLLTDPYLSISSRIRQSIGVKLVPEYNGRQSLLVISINRSTDVINGSHGGWVDTYSYAPTPPIGMIGDTRSITTLLNRMQKIRQGVGIVTCNKCHYYYSSPGSRYCGMGRPILTEDCIDYTKGAPHTVQNTYKDNSNGYR